MKGRVSVGIHIFDVMQDLNISLLQPDLVWEDRQANLARLEQIIRASSEATEVILLPEMFTTGFSMRPELLAEDMDGSAVHWMRRLAAERKVILAGSLISVGRGARVAS